jgi:hypothetical protein
MEDRHEQDSSGKRDAERIADWSTKLAQPDQKQAIMGLIQIVKNIGMWEGRREVPASNVETVLLINPQCCVPTQVYGVYQVGSP